MAASKRPEHGTKQADRDSAGLAWLGPAVELAWGAILMQILRWLQVCWSWSGTGWPLWRPSCVFYFVVWV